MARARRKTDTTANLGFEAKLLAAAYALHNNMDAAEYKHVVLGLIFLGRDKQRRGGNANTAWRTAA